MFKVGDRVQSTDRKLRNRQGNGTVTHFNAGGTEFHVEYDTKISQRTHFGMWHKNNTKKLKFVVDTLDPMRYNSSTS
jgi:hypothetical protein